MTDLRLVAFGTERTERAVLWSVVGGLIVFYSFPLFGSPPPIEDGRVTRAAWVAIAVVLAAVLAALVRAYTAGGVFACIVLVFGPIVGALSRVIEPQYVETPYLEALAVALTAAIAVGIFTYLLGRIVWRLRRRVGGKTEPEADSDSGSGENSDGTASEASE